MTRIVLAAPAASSATGGAATYNRRMIEALSDAGLPAELLDLRGPYPTATPDPADAALLAALPPTTCLILDGLALGLHAAAPRAGAALIHHPSALHGQAGADRAALRAAEQAALNALPLVIASSDSAAARLVQEYAVDPARLRTVPPGVDRLHRVTPSPGVPVHLLSLGPLVPRRAHDLLLQALARLIALPWRLTLAGAPHRDPVHAASLSALIAELELSARVTLRDPAGGVPWDDADLLVLAHPVPVMTGVLRQALQRGIPLVLAAGHDLIHAPDAVALTPPGDAATLSKVLRRLIFDRDLRAEMALAAWRAGATLPDWRRQAALFQAAIAPLR